MYATGSRRTRRRTSSSNARAASGVEHPPRVGVQRRAVDAEHVREQHLGVEPRRVDARRLERLDGRGERVAQR